MLHVPEIYTQNQNKTKWMKPIVPKEPEAKRNVLHVYTCIIANDTNLSMKLCGRGRLTTKQDEERICRGTS